MNREDAITLARILNGRPIQGGGDTWYVRIKAGDNRYVSIDTTGLTEYRTQDCTGYQSGNKNEEIVNVEWENARTFLPDFNPSV